MKIVCLMAAVCALVSGPRLHAEEGRLRPSAAGVRREVLAVIEGQLAAFRAHDIARAYGFASAALKRQFPIARFAETVRQGYPEIWSNARSEFGIVLDNGVRAQVQVRVFQSGGASASYDFVLLKEPGGWRVTSVTLHPPTPDGSDSA